MLLWGESPLGRNYDERAETRKGGSESRTGLDFLPISYISADIRILQGLSFILIIFIEQ